MSPTKLRAALGPIVAFVAWAAIFFFIGRDYGRHQEQAHQSEKHSRTAPGDIKMVYGWPARVDAAAGTVKFLQVQRP